MKKYIGIDPGVHGGIAVLSDDGSVVEVAKMPTTPMDLLDFLSKYKDDSFCILERVGGMPGNGRCDPYQVGEVLPAWQ